MPIIAVRSDEVTDAPSPDRIVLDGGLATELARRGADLGDRLRSSRLLIDEPPEIGDYGTTSVERLTDFHRSHTLLHDAFPDRSSYTRVSDLPTHAHAPVTVFMQVKLRVWKPVGTTGI
jgi:hypothetical protein